MTLKVARENVQSDALEKLVRSAYQDLHRIAHRQMRGERVGHTLQTTALVNEAYLRMIELKDIEYSDRHHFLAVAAGTMRRILVDRARSVRAQKRGGDRLRVTLDDHLPEQRDDTIDVCALDAALHRLTEQEPALTRLIELRYFGGLTIVDAAAALGISVATAKRKWRFAQAWLFRALQAEAE
jgi:RNA polymerase sigma factor (TIGR02999 family)